MRLQFLMSLIWLFCTALAIGGETEPELASDPRVTEILSKLGDNSSAMLPETKVIGDVGPIGKEFHCDKRGPGGRDYTIKMAWMPDRKRAFFCGANHGTPHRMNDAWEFDLPSNSWVVLYAADYNDRGAITDYDKKTLSIKEGWLRTTGGGPGHPAHTWWGLTYNPQLKAVLWMCAWPNYRLKEKLDTIGATSDQLTKAHPPLWAFYPETKKWEPLLTQPAIRIGFGGAMEYIDDLKTVLWMYRDTGTTMLDPATLTWKDISKGKVRIPSESVIYYDSSRKLLVAHSGPNKDGEGLTFHMAVTGNAQGEWKNVVQKRELPKGHDAGALFYYDPIGKVGLLYETEAHAIWAYDPDATTWTKLTPQGPPPPEKGNARAVAYFDPERNVFVVNQGTATWVYRYKSPKQ